MRRIFLQCWGVITDLLHNCRLSALQYTELIHHYTEPDAEDYFFRLLRMPAALF